MTFSAGATSAAYVAGFRDELLRLGYTPLTTAGHVRLMAHLSKWLAGQDLSASALTVSTVEEYFAQRRAAGGPRCVERGHDRGRLDQ